MIEGSGSRAGSGSGSIPLTSGSGSGSGMPKNMWIRIRMDPDLQHCYKLYISRQTLYHFRITYSYINMCVCVYMCVCVWILVCVCMCMYMCMCVCVHICVQLHIYIYIICAKYSDFLCIWLRKCDFLTEKLGIKLIPNPDWPDTDPKWFIPDPNPDLAKSSGSDRIRIRIHNTVFRSYTVFTLSGESHRGGSGPHEGCPQWSEGEALWAHHQGDQDSLGATQCPRYQVGHIEEVVILMRVVLKCLEEGLSETTITLRQAFSRCCKIAVKSII